MIAVLTTGASFDFEENMREILSLLMAITVSTALLSASGALSQTAAIPSSATEIEKQWKYLDQLKVENQQAVGKKSRRLMTEIRRHFRAHGLQFETDPADANILLLKVLSKRSLDKAHALNRFATSLFQKFDGLRVEVSPLKLKLSQAGALYDEDTNRLTLAYDNVVHLRSDSFVGHELIHAKFYRRTAKGHEHPYFGYLHRVPGTPALQAVYPDAFSLDELPAFYYQILALLHESKRNPASLRNAFYFLDIALQLVGHLESSQLQSQPEALLQDPAGNSIVIADERKVTAVKITTRSYVLEIGLLGAIGAPKHVVLKRALLRVQKLKGQVALIASGLRQAQQALAQGDRAKAIEILSQSRDIILN